MRADARRNYERLLREARAAFTEHGTDVSLEEIARRAGVGIGTLYRHFPNRPALLQAVFSDRVAALLAGGTALMDAPDPGRALTSWLHDVVAGASATRGLAAELMNTAVSQGSVLETGCGAPIRERGSALLLRAQEAGAYRTGTDMADVMKLLNAIAWASEQTPEDPGLADRLLTLALDGLLVSRDG